MNYGKFLKRGFAVVAVGTLCACSTPRAALDQANHGTKLMSLLEIQLQEFRRVQGAAEQSRLQSIRAQKSVLLEVEGAAQLDIVASRSAGDTVREPLAARMVADAEGVSVARANVASSKVAYDQKLNALLAPLPSTSSAMTEAQGKLAQMGVELSRKTRHQELLAFARDIKASIDENKQKIKDAEATAEKTEEAVKSAVQVDAATSSVQPPKP